MTPIDALHHTIDENEAALAILSFTSFLFSEIADDDLNMIHRRRNMRMM